MEHNSVPSQAQLALAIAIVKQKPVDMDIKEHILQIRQFIRTTRNSDRSYVDDKFFDSVSFWQQAYEKSEAEQSRLLDRIYELEQRNETLLSKLRTRNIANEDMVEESTKRKANVNKSAAGTVRKRAKTQGYPLGHIVPDNNGRVYDDVLVQFEYMEESTGSFMRHFYTLQQVLQKRPNSSNIVKYAVTLCEIAGNEVLTSVREKRVTPGRLKKKPLLQTRPPDITAVLRSAECAFHLILQALQKLSTTENTTQYAGQITYHLVRLYEIIAKALELHCIIKSQQIPANTNAKGSKKKAKRGKTGHAADTPELNSEDEIARQISRLLGSMALSLDLSCIDHQNTLEGFLFILLNRVGNLLCLFVFQDLQLRPGLHMDPIKLPLPQGLEGVKLDDQSLCASHMEARHLIWPLERILALLDVFESSSSLPTLKNSHGNMIFVSRINERLQSTLLQAVFGSDKTILQRTTLQRPAQHDVQELDGLSDCPQIPNQSVPSWFTQEVWRLLGWELLMNKSPSKEQ